MFKENEFVPTFEQSSSTVVIIDMAWREVILSGRRDQTGELVLNGAKFIIVLEWLW